MNYTVERIKANERAIQVSTGTVFSYHAHIHSYYEIILYEPFFGNVTVNESVVNVKSYTCIMVAPLDLHKIDVIGETDARFIKLKVTAEALGVEHSYPSFVLSGIEKNDFLTALFGELLRDGQSEQYISHLVNAAVLQVVCRGESSGCIKRGEMYRFASEAARILHEEFASSISQSDVAKRISISPQYLSKIFKQIFEVGFSDYLADIRLRYAAKLLTETDRPITEICFECGFGNLSHFLRSFKKKYNLTPRDFRKNSIQSYQFIIK